MHELSASSSLRRLRPSSTLSSVKPVALAGLIGLLSLLVNASPTRAQSLSIQSGGLWGGGIQFGFNTGRYGHPFDTPLGHPYGYGIHTPWPSQRFDYADPWSRPGYRSYYGYGSYSFSPDPYRPYQYGISPYDNLYRYRGSYFDYRNDYYDRLMDNYRLGIERDLRYQYPQYQNRYVEPLAPGLGLGLPPIARIEPDDPQLNPYLYDGLEPAETSERLPGTVRAARPADLTGELRYAVTRLQNSLLRRRDDADVWLDYLAPARIIQSLERDSNDQGSAKTELTEILQNYDGAIANPQLRSITQADGFADTRRLLRQWIAKPAQASTPKPSADKLSPSDERPSSEAEGARTKAAEPLPASSPKKRTSV